MNNEEIVIKMKKSEAPPSRRAAKKLVIPRRQPSAVVPPQRIAYITADKTTCEKCTCYPREDPYVNPKKLNPCQISPLTLYELAATIVDRMELPEAFQWSEEQVADWISVDVGLPEYKECILDNHIDGMRLLMLEDPSKLPEINIHNFKHIQIITTRVRQLYKTDFIKFMRSISLPPRKPLTHCTWFKSRTGPSWGVRQNWSRCDILRWMKVLAPEPVTMGHWDLVWYQKPDYPKVLFGKIPKKGTDVIIPHYVAPPGEVYREYLVPRKFRFQTGIPEEGQMIWMEERIDVQKKVTPLKPAKVSRVTPKKISLEGLGGDELLLAKRKMPKSKFFM